MSNSAVAIPMITQDDELMGSISTLADALAILADAGITVHSTEEFGSGFKVIEDKNDLVKVPFIILGMKFSAGEYGDSDFAILHVVTEKGDKYIVTDGSSGICSQAKQYAARNITAGLMVPNGLLKSEYDFCNIDAKTKLGCGTALKQGKCECGDQPLGAVSKASTYYLS